MRLHKLFFVLVLIASICMPVNIVEAEIAGDDAFNDMKWEKVFEGEPVNKGIIQSVCVTDNYIITIENTADDTKKNDTVTAYYRYDHDENGKAVEPYSIAKQVCESDWEHGNGMAYNPKTNEIYVALYTSLKEGNEGCLYIMDPETLLYKGKVQVNPSYNILGIDYIKETDQYVIQTNGVGQYSVKILNADFEEVEDLGPMPTNPGINYQDLCTSEDYVLLSPLSPSGDGTDYVNVYSLSRREVIKTTVLVPDIPANTSTELESICVTGKGEFLIVENGYVEGKRRIFQFYQSKVPYFFDVKLEGRHGTVTSENEKVLRGEACNLKLEAQEGYELGSLMIGDEDIDLSEHPDGYTIKDVQDDLEVVLRCTPKVLKDTDVQSKKASSKTIISVLVLFILLPSIGVVIAMKLALLYTKRKERRVLSRGHRRADKRKVQKEYQEIFRTSDESEEAAPADMAASVSADQISEEKVAAKEQEPEKQFSFKWLEAKKAEQQKKKEARQKQQERKAAQKQKREQLAESIRVRKEKEAEEELRKKREAEEALRREQAAKEQERKEREAKEQRRKERKPKQQRKPADRKPADRKPIDRKPVDRKLVENKTVERRTAERKASAESRYTERRKTTNRVPKSQAPSHDRVRNQEANWPTLSSTGRQMRRPESRNVDPSYRKSAKNAEDRKADRTKKKTSTRNND